MPKSGEMLSTMLVIATNAHHGQFDLGKKPYILHPLSVMNLINSDDEELLCIALGHDLFEDTKVTAQELIAKGISDRVIQGIIGVTKMPGQSYEEYQETVFETSDRMIVKHADLLHNSDMRRLKKRYDSNGNIIILDKDIERTIKYQKFYLEIEARLPAKLEEEAKSET